MTVWISVFCAEHPPYEMDCLHWRFEVATVEEALRRARVHAPDAGELATRVIIDCDKGACITRLHLPRAEGIEQARSIAAGRAGWFTVPRRGALADHCQFHTEPLCQQRGTPGSARPQARRTSTGQKRSRVAGEQIDLFSGDTS